MSIYVSMYVWFPDFFPLQQCLYLHSTADMEEVPEEEAESSLEVSHPDMETLVREFLIIYGRKILWRSNCKWEFRSGICQQKFINLKRFLLHLLLLTGVQCYGKYECMHVCLVSLLPNLWADICIYNILYANGVKSLPNGLKEVNNKDKWYYIFNR